MEPTFALIHNTLAAVIQDAGQQWLTRDSIMTIAASSAAVTAICNALQRVFNFNPKWLALVLSLLIAVLCFIYIPSKDPKDGLSYFLAVVNGFLIFSAATGVTSAGSNAGNKGPQPEGVVKRKFFTPWF